MATGREVADRSASETGISRAAAAETEMRLEAVPRDTTDPGLAVAAVVVRPVWDLGEASVEVVVAAGAAAGAGRCPAVRTEMQE